VSLDTTTGYPRYQSKDYGILSADSVIHLKAGIVKEFLGISPIGISARAITIAMSQEAAVSSTIESGGNPRLAFIHPNTLNEAARQAISNQYLKNHTGKNSGRPVVLAENMRIEQLSSANEDAGLEAARKYSITDVSRIYGVPVCYLSETGSSVYGSLEWSSRAYLDNCLSHWLETWKAEIFLKLNTTVTFDTDFITRPTLVETYAALRTGVEAGIITPNEARAALDYAPIEGGDKRVVALNMGTGGGQTNIGTDTSKQQDEPSQ
jgi:HK97 family phage portal protein